MNEEIERQRRQVFSGEAKVVLHAPCTVRSGIVRIENFENDKLNQKVDSLNETISFFIPASGSGSRMFQFIHENDDVLIKQLRENFNNLAISREINIDSGLGDLMKYSDLPKGLIPFHLYGDEATTAFQEHVLQAKALFNNAKVHFTIQKDFEDRIRENIRPNVDGVELSFSFQNPETNAYCFDADQQLIKTDGEILRRPAGHGALLENLNRVNADIILIKNIDNIQHLNKSEKGAEAWRQAIGLLKLFLMELSELITDFNKDHLKQFNDKYMLISEEDLGEIEVSDVEKWAKRPTRVCGMVINEGEPGGGPFWIEKNGCKSKQIVEKVQISNDENQQEIVQESTHFNPVFIALTKRDAYGNPLDLHDFKDESQYINVHKSQNGEDVYYRELPGLWNGGMSNWNTIFFEIPASAFSPVKTLLDLAKDPHQP